MLEKPKINEESEILKSLNDMQKQGAVTTEGPLLVLAGAGSGKTKMMTHRMAYLILEKNVDPQNILAVTFTNKAANEMKQRAEFLIHSRGRSLKGLWIKTFHATCLAILKNHAGALGYGENFLIYTASDQKAAVKRAIKECEISPKEYPVKMFTSFISKCKSQKIVPDEVFDYFDDSFKTQISQQVYEAYQNVLKANNAMDFDDLLLNTVILFSKYPDILKIYAERFKYIMVDEYQDTSSLQFELINKLAHVHKNICVVGDDDQCIYEWRGATIENILSFEKVYKGTKIIKLERNYRSTKNILDAAHAVISNNSKRKEKKLWTGSVEGEKISIEVYENAHAEAEFIVDKIRQVVAEEGKTYKDIAILYRNNSQSRLFEEALKRWDVPYRILSGIRFYERSEIVDMLAYLRVTENPSDDIAFLRCINEPARGLGKKALEKVASFARERGISLFAGLLMDECLAELSAAARRGAEEFIKMIKHAQDMLLDENTRISNVLKYIIETSGYERKLKLADTLESDAKLENIYELVASVADREGSSAGDDEKLTLSAFLEEIALISDVDNHDETADAVVLMTLHSSKGLEFNVVFIPGMEEGIFPSGQGDDNPGKIEEERRLCYVGFTRAKEELFLSAAKWRRHYYEDMYMQPSRFLDEVPEELVKTNVVEASSRDRYTDGYAGDPIASPFKKIKPVNTVKEKMLTAKPVSEKEFSDGDTVEHDKFGRGLIIAQTEKVWVIAFDDGGIKKLAKGIADIRKV